MGLTPFIFMPKLSIIVPVFNEEQTISSVLEKLMNLPKDKELIVIDDGSVDGTSEIINSFLPDIKLIKHENNQGKGAAIRSGIARAQGDFIVFCDADLEYDVNQIGILFDYISQKNAAVVYGSRFINYQPKKNRIHYLGNRFLTGLTNLFFGAKLTDMETAYKMFRADILKKMSLTAMRFEIEPEITAKILKQGIFITELPITYDPRAKRDGKKIKYRDGLVALKILIEEKFRG